jgi:hypothetical protein
MAGRGYLGKISAILTADSKGLSRGLNAGAKDVTQFARKIQSTISGATSRAGREFDNILTPLQKLQRALKVGVGQNLKLVNQQEVQAIRQFAEAAERIAKPVSQAAKDFAGLSTQVQRNFAPALESAQKAAEQLRTSIGNGARVSERDFANLEARINRVTQAASRLREAGQATAGLASGQELRFQRPGFLQQTSRAAALQQQAAALSPEQIQGSGVAALVGQQRQAAQEAANLLSTLERIRATRNGDAQAAEAAYNRQVASLRLVNDQLEREITLSQQAANAQREAAADAQRRAEAASRFLNVDQRESNLIANEGQQQDIRAYLQLLEQARARTEALTDAQRRAEAASRFLNVDQRESNLIANEGQQQDIREYIQLLEQARARTEALADAQRRAEAASRFLVVDQRESNLIASEGQQTDVRAYLQLLEDARIRTDALADAQRRAEAASRFLNVDQSGSQLLSNQGAASRVNPQQAFLDRVGGEITAVRNQLRELPDLAGSLGPVVDNLTTRWQNLGRAGVGFTADQLRRVQQETQAIQAALNSRRGIGQQFLQNFGGEGVAGLSLGIDERQLRSVGSQIEFVQNRLSRLTAEQRGPAVAALEAYRQAAFRAFSGTADSAEQAAADIARTRQELIRTAAAAEGVRPGRFAEDFRRAGDQARGFGDRAGLAIQQAAFAVEDFFSVTGGLDQRIRAAGNNISQLGFIIGGTTGLIAGISAAIGAQLVAALINWYNNGRKSEDQTKALNAALADQKRVVDALAESYKKVAEAVQDAGLSQQGQRNASIRRQVEEIQQQQRQAREQRIQAVDVGVAAARGDVARFERELNAATTPGEQIRARLQLQAAQERQRQEEQRAVRDANRNGAGNVRQRVIAALEAEIRGETQRAFAGARAAGNSGAFQLARDTERRNEARIAGLQNIGQSPDEAIRVLEERINALRQSGATGDIIQPLQQIREQLLVQVRQIEADKLAARISREALRIADAMNAAQADIASAFEGVIGASAIEEEIAAFAESLAQLQKAAGEAAQAGRVEEARALNDDVNAIKAHINALRDAAAAVKTFGSELARLSESVAQDVATLEQRAEQARREDVARGTPETAAQRTRAEEDVRNARRAQQEFEDRRASAIERMEQDSIRNGDPRFRRLREIDAMLSAPANDTGADGTRGGTAEERAAAREERRRLQESINADAERDPEVQAARRQRDDMTRRAERAASGDRGRELAMTPVQRARREVEQSARDITEAFTVELQGQRFVADVAGRNAALNRLAEQQLQQVAPMLAGFREERMNAMLQGPSRAALNVADAQTMEGNRELNRLLRGDDPNKDVNLVELQKQSELLQGVIDAINEQAGQDVVEIRG